MKSSLLAWYLFYRYDSGLAIESPHKIQEWIDEFNRMSPADVYSLLRSHYREVATEAEPPGLSDTPAAWVVTATVRHHTSNGIRTVQIPTFFLSSHVQGILNAPQARQIAEEIINPLKDNLTEVQMDASPAAYPNSSAAGVCQPL